MEGMRGFQVNFTADQIALIKAAAAKRGLSASAYIRESAIIRAQGETK